MSYSKSNLLGSQPGDLPTLEALGKERLESVAILIKESKNNLKICVKDIGTKLTETQGQNYVKFARLLHSLGMFQGFNFGRSNRRAKTASFCCGDIEIELVENNYQVRGQKVFMTDWIPKNCSKHPNHDRNSSVETDDNLEQQSDSSEDEQDPPAVL